MPFDADSVDPVDTSTLDFVCHCTTARRNLQPSLAGISYSHWNALVIACSSFIIQRRKTNAKELIELKPLSPFPPLWVRTGTWTHKMHFESYNVYFPPAQRQARTSNIQHLYRRVLSRFYFLHQQLLFPIKWENFVLFTFFSFVFYSFF